jgi:hypothetical protein
MQARPRNRLAPTGPAASAIPAPRAGISRCSRACHPGSAAAHLVDAGRPRDGQAVSRLRLPRPPFRLRGRGFRDAAGPARPPRRLAAGPAAPAAPGSAAADLVDAGRARDGQAVSRPRLPRPPFRLRGRGFRDATGPAQPPRSPSRRAGLRGGRSRRRGPGALAKRGRARACRARCARLRGCAFPMQSRPRNRPAASQPRPPSRLRGAHLARLATRPRPLEPLQ